MADTSRPLQDRALACAVLDEAQVLHMAMAGADGPYLAAVCFGRVGDALYVHGSPKGRKMQMLRNDGRVCFQVETRVRMVPHRSACKWSVHFRSVVGFGTAVEVNDPEEKSRGLEAIVAHYGGDGPMDPKVAAATCVVRIDIEQMSVRLHEPQGDRHGG